MKEPIFKQFCCCCSLKTGSRIYVAFILFFSALELFLRIINVNSGDGPFDFDELMGLNKLMGYKWANYFGMFCSAVSIVTCLLFFRGVSSSMKILLTPFLIYQSIYLVLESIMLFLNNLIFGIIVFFLRGYLTICVYSYYVTMKYPPRVPPYAFEQGSPNYAQGSPTYVQGSPAFAPQVYVQQEMPQNYQPQNAYYPVPTAPSNQQTSTPYFPNLYPPQPYNPNINGTTSYGPNSMPPSYSDFTDNSTNDCEKLPEKSQH
ncbi:uncharacterized protein [Chironomus tepperi]|uniref:uncharacterized protein n=1 Tax=Chironomus tepperi TaxID=113505 RepID=UPI00391FAD4F